MGRDGRRIAAAQGAKIGLPEMDLGTVPAWGGSARAIFDYAEAGEKLSLFRSPLILCVDPPSLRWDGKLASQSTRRFVQRLGRQQVVRVGPWGAECFKVVDKIVAERGVTHLYIQKGGQADGLRYTTNPSRRSSSIPTRTGPSWTIWLRRIASGS